MIHYRVVIADGPYYLERALNTFTAEGWKLHNVTAHTITIYDRLEVRYTLVLERLIS